MRFKTQSNEDLGKRHSRQGTACSKAPGSSEFVESKELNEEQSSEVP